MPYTDKQKEYIANANHRWNFKTGAVRSGKSYVDVTAVIPMRIRERIGKDGLVFIIGVSKETIERNVLQPMRERYGKSIVGEINNRNIAHVCGEDVYCLGAEKVSQVAKIQGASAKYVYGDEVAKWHKDVFSMLKSRLDKPYSCFDGSLNPEYPDHWLKKFLDQKDIDIYCQKYTIFDNSSLSQSFIDNLCKEYQGTIFYDRLILGEWVRAEGAIYKVFIDNKDDYIISKDKILLDKNDKDKDDKIKIEHINIGVDFGGNKSQHAFVATGFDINKKYVYVLKSQSINAKGTSVEDIRKAFTKFADEIKDTYGFVDDVYCDSAEQAIINEFRNKTDYKIRNSVKNEIIDRIRCEDVLISSRRLFILENENEALISGLLNAVWDDKQLNDVRLDDGTSNIDILDAFEYSFEPYIKRLLRR